jgi:hypothetical protein
LETGACSRLLGDPSLAIAITPVGEGRTHCAIHHSPNCQTAVALSHILVNGVVGKARERTIFHKQSRFNFISRHNG